MGLATFFGYVLLNDMYLMVAFVLIVFVCVSHIRLVSYSCFAFILLTVMIFFGSVGLEKLK